MFRSLILLIFNLIFISPAFANELPFSTCKSVMQNVLFNGDEMTDVYKKISEDVLNLPEVPANVAQTHNQMLVQELDNDLLCGNKCGISSAEAREIFKRVALHPVAGLSNVSHYDPQGHIGFCFGRALAVQLETLLRRIPAKYVRKIWATGKFGSNGKQEWRYHVTTIVWTQDGWVAIDPIMGRPISVGEWYRRMQQMDIQGDMQMFLTEGKRFSPHTPRTFKKTLAVDSYHNGYFRDLIELFKTEAAAIRKRRLLFPARQ